MGAGGLVKSVEIMKAVWRQMLTSPTNSPEQIAFKLLEKIAKVEKKHLSEPMGTMAYGWSMADREWILKTYGQCLNTVSGHGYQRIKEFE